MTFREAKQLHNEDEVLLKSNKTPLSVVGDVEVVDKTVLVSCNDGNTYTHEELL